MTKLYFAKLQMCLFFYDNNLKSKVQHLCHVQIDSEEPLMSRETHFHIYLQLFYITIIYIYLREKKIIISKTL